MSKRSRTDAKLTEMKRTVQSKVPRTDEATDTLSTTTQNGIASKSEALYKEIQKWFTEGNGVGTDNDYYGNYKEKMKICKNVSNLITNSKALMDLQTYISSSINSMLNDNFELLLIDCIVSYLFDWRVLQLFEYFVTNNDIAFDMNDTYKYNDIMNYELLYYISRQELKSNILFDDNIKQMLEDIGKQKVNMSLFVNQLLFHEPIDFDCEYPNEIDEEYISSILGLQNIFKKYDNDKNWKFYSIFFPEIYDADCMEMTMDNIKCYNEEKDVFEMFPYCGTKYIVMHCVSEDTMIIMWGSYGMDESWLDREDFEQ